MSTTEHPRIGVIGCGAIAELYHLPALAAMAGVRERLVLADPNPTRLAAMAEAFQVTRTVEDYRQLAGEVDGVIIAVPPGLHHPISMFFLQRGVHVLCEKPLAESAAEAQEMVATAKRNGVALAVNQTRRLFPNNAKVRELIADGVLGELQSIIYHDGVKFNWPAASPFHFVPGAKGVLSDVGIHLLDTICWWLDAQPTLVSSLNDSYGGPEAVATVRLRYGQCDIEAKVSRLARLRNSFRLVGTLGTIDTGAESWNNLTIQFNTGRSQTIRLKPKVADYNALAQPLLGNFVDVIARGAAPLISGQSALPAVALLEEAYASAERYDDSRFSLREKLVVRGANKDDPLRVLVTGASGFVGGRAVEAMTRTGLAEPVAGIRGWSRAARVARAPVEMAVCNILDAQQVGEVVGRVDAVVHCAYGDERESIVGGTKNLLEAAARHGIERFVFLSTAEVYGPNVSGDVNEQHATPTTGGMYGDAKIEAEELCRSFVERGVQATILRPSLIYGPFGQSWTINVAKRLQSGRWGEFEGYGDGIANLIYVDDLVQAILRALQKPNARGETFNVNGPQPPTWNEYFRRFNEALDLPSLTRVSSSKSRWRTAAMDLVGKATDVVRSRFQDRLMRIYLRGGWAGRMMKRLKGALDATPSGNELHGLYGRKAVYRDDKIRDLLGYTPQFDLTTGLEMSVAWLRHHGYTSDWGQEIQPEPSQAKHAGVKYGQSISELQEAAR